MGGIFTEFSRSFKIRMAHLKKERKERKTVQKVKNNNSKRRVSNRSTHFQPRRAVFSGKRGEKQAKKRAFLQKNAPSIRKKNGQI